MSFDLRQMEAELKRNVWIREAQLFFDNNQVLRVNVTERQPVARIFTRQGSSFLMDSSGVQMPLSDKFPARVPVFTGYPDAAIRIHGTDSALTSQIRILSAYILSQPFWMSQLSQIDITPDRTFEMIPVVGNHIIAFGDGDGYEQKFHRLFIFYKEVLSKTGFDRYSKIDVEFDGQVIGTKKGSTVSRMDSLQAIRNIQQLIMTARQLQADTVSRQDTRPLERSTMTEQTLTNYDLVPENDNEHRSVPGNNHPPTAKKPRKE
jgi:cell division protein FtsQ